MFSEMPQLSEYKVILHDTVCMIGPTPRSHCLGHRTLPVQNALKFVCDLKATLVWKLKRWKFVLSHRDLNDKMEDMQLFMGGFQLQGVATGHLPETS